MRALDRLPWPWGERILGAVFVVSKCLIRPGRLGQALRWAAAQPGVRSRWRLVVATAFHHGIVFARMAAVGLRGPETLRGHVVLRGREHLENRPGGVILLGFHLGMPTVGTMLRVLGYRLHRVGAPVLGAWDHAAWRPLVEDDDELALREGEVWGPVLRRVCQLLREGQAVYMTADGGQGREAFRVPLPGGALIVGRGWLAMRDGGDATVLPIFTHREGCTTVISVHPPLPRDVTECARVLGGLLDDYVRRHPEQCHSLAFPPFSEA